MTISAISTDAAAAATVLSAVFIAVQAFYTRKSLESTKDALVISQDELEHGRALRADAQRAAIDAEMPRLTVEVVVQSSAAFRLAGSTVGEAGSRPQHEALSPGELFTTPRDNKLILQVFFKISIANDGPRRARVAVRNESKDVEIMLRPGDKEQLDVTRTQTLSEWIKIAIDREEGRPCDEPAVATVTYIFPGDSGAIEHHHVVQGGTIVERVPDDAGGWRLKSFARTAADPYGSVNAVTQPFTRKYWASRTNNREL